MIHFSRFLALTLLTAILSVGSLAHAGAAQNYLEAKQRQLTSIIRKPKTAANDKKLTTTFDAILDYDSFARSSLGDKWGKYSEAETKEFQKLLTILVQRSYTKNVRDTLDYKIKFKGQQVAKKGELVQTVAKHKTDARKETISIDYLVHKVKGSWRVFDIITEGESLVSNYKSQFRRVIKKDGFSGLLERMRKKVAEG